jgi:D-3-phosphoglycerate dehydrogenase
MVSKPEGINPLEGLWTPEDRPTYLLDWDSTLCSRETLDFLADLVLIGQANEQARSDVHDFTHQGMGGEMSFPDSLAQRFALFKARREDVAEAGRQLVELLDPTALERRDEIEANQERIHVVSGGFEELITPSLARLGIAPDNVHANTFVYDDDGFVVGADPSRLTSQDDGKAAQVAALGIDGLKVVVGDGYNDYRIKALGQADIFVAYTRHWPRQNVIELADAQIDRLAKPLLT